MADWKPTYWRTNGKRGTTDALRKVGIKLLENMKHRNEEVGNYANPVQRFSYDGIKFMISSLPGYDIVDITIPELEEELEPTGTAEIYSGFWEPRHQPNGQQHYLMWYPSGYELYNSSLSNPVPAGLGASVDGNAEEILNGGSMPPNRWMQNDYTHDPEDGNSREEAPWFVENGPPIAAASIHPGKYSGKLRELVQMQIGYGSLPQFSYTASNSNGIYLETLDEDTTRVWLIQVSGTNGIVMQIMTDYSIEKFERSARLETGAIPPEIEEAGWFALQTSFDSSRAAYTKAEYDAIPEDERPDIRTVTFELLSGVKYRDVVDGYSSYGDYGWSFNSAGTKAVFCGIAWNTPPGGGLASNYKSNLFTITINPDVLRASVHGAGDTPFLMVGKGDHVKFPNANGTLESQFFFKGENGFNGTQPSTNYTAPIYAYHNLNDQLVTCTYEYTEGTYETKNGGHYDPMGWTETIACRELTTWGENPSHPNYHYKGCAGSTSQSGTGTFGIKHGFTTSITSADVYNIYSGYSAQWPAVAPFAGLDQSIFFAGCFDKKIVFSPSLAGTAYANMDEHWVEKRQGSFSGSTKSVLIVPSFERLAFYHYKSLNTVLGGAGQLRYDNHFLYERGTPIRQHGTPLLGDDCAYTGCGPGLGSKGPIYPSLEDKAEYYMARGANQDRFSELYFGCSPTGQDCFFGGTLYYNRAPDPDYSYSESTETITGGLELPDGSSIAFSEDEINVQSKPFRESSAAYGHQSVVSLFDTFSSKYIFSMPNITMTARKHTATGFPDDFTHTGVLFSGMPYFL